MDSIKTKKVKIKKENEISEEYSIEDLANDPSVCGAAQCFYQAERMSTLQAQNPSKNQQELVTMAINEWNSSLTLNHKIKYLRIAERMGLAKLYRSYSISRKPLTLTEMLKREPKKPPKNGYSLFTSEQLAKYVNVEPQKRMTEVARIWRQVISKEEKEQFDSRNKILLAKYQKDFEDFIETLTPDERRAYEEYRKRKSKHHKNKKRVQSSKKVSTKKKRKKELSSDGSIEP